MSSVNPTTGIVGLPLNTAGLEEGKGMVDEANGADGDAASAEQVSAQDLTGGSPSAVDPSARRFAPDSGSYLAANGSAPASGAATVDGAGDGANASGARGGRGADLRWTFRESQNAYLALRSLYTDGMTIKGENPLAWLEQKFGEDGARELFIRWSREDGKGARFLDHHECMIVRAGATALLISIGTPDVIPALVERSDPAHEPMDFIRVKAALALGQMGADEAIPALMENIAFFVTRDLTFTGSMLWPALSMLCRFNTPDVREFVLAKVVNAADPKIRSAGVEALGSFGTPDVIPHLLYLAASEGDKDAMKQLVRIGAWEVVPLLIQSLSRGEFLASVVPMLTEFAEREALYQRAHESFLHLSHIYPVPSIPEGCRTAQAVPALLGALAESREANDANTPVLIAIARALGAIEADNDETIAAFSGLMQHQNQDVRVAAVEALARIDRVEAQRLILAALKDSSAKVRAAAVKIGGMNWWEWMLPRLKEMAGDPEVQVRAAVAAAVGKMGVLHDEEVLFRLATEDPSSEVRDAAREAFRNLHDEEVTRLAKALSNPEMNFDE